MSKDRITAGADPHQFAKDSWAAWLVWSAMVGSFDAVLRLRQGIYEFTDDPECILRIGLASATEPASLADGTNVRIGEPICALHFWNEHLPQYSDGGPDLRWALEMRRRLDRSLRTLARHIEEDPRWRGVEALRGYAAFSSRIGIPQLYRVARRLGFECPGAEHDALWSWTDSIAGYVFALAYNPVAARRQPFLRHTHRIWMSRRILVTRYAPGRASARRRGPAAPLSWGAPARPVRRNNGRARS